VFAIIKHKQNPQSFENTIIFMLGFDSNVLNELETVEYLFNMK